MLGLTSQTCLFMLFAKLKFSAHSGILGFDGNKTEPRPAVF